jgi:hypothetical protein
VTTLADLPYGFNVETLDGQRAYQSPAEMGVVLRRRVSTRKVRQWRVTWDIAPRGVYESVLELWRANGSVAAMNWTSPESASVRVRFVSRPEVALLSRSHVALSILLEEVL